jgi:hypothetical protein
MAAKRADFFLDIVLFNFAVVFSCQRVQYNVLQKYFFDLTTLGDLKMFICGCNFSSNLVQKYVK